VRTCLMCPNSLEGRRPQATTCSRKCRRKLQAVREPQVQDIPNEEFGIPAVSDVRIIQHDGTFEIRQPYTIAQVLKIQADRKRVQDRMDRQDKLRQGKAGGDQEREREELAELIQQERDRVGSRYVSTVTDAWIARVIRQRMKARKVEQAKANAGNGSEDGKDQRAEAHAGGAVQ
jgi:hypothetical protein